MKVGHWQFEFSVLGNVSPHTMCSFEVLRAAVIKLLTQREKHLAGFKPTTCKMGHYLCAKLMIVSPKSSSYLLFTQSCNELEISLLNYSKY